MAEYFFPTGDTALVGRTHTQDVILGTLIDEVIHLALKQGRGGREPWQREEERKC